MHLKLRAASSGSSGEARAERKKARNFFPPPLSSALPSFHSLIHQLMPTMFDFQDAILLLWKIVNILEFVLHLSLMRLQNYQAFPLAFKLPSLPVHKKVQPIYRHLFNKLLLTWKRKKAEKNPDLMASFWYQFVGIHKNNGNEKMKGIMFHRTMRCQGHVSVFCGVGIFFCGNDVWLVLCLAQSERRVC